MDFNRIDKELKYSIENVPYSLEIDGNLFLNAPEIIQQERKEFTKAHPFKKPDHILVKDIFIPSSEDGYDIRLHVYQSENFNRKGFFFIFMEEDMFLDFQNKWTIKCLK